MVFAETAWSIAGDRKAPLSTRSRFSFGWWSPYMLKLDEVARRMYDRGISMAYHPHMGTPIESWADILNLMGGSSDAVGLLLDTGHLAFAGIDPLDVIAKHGRRINHVHCKDVRKSALVRAKLADSSFLDAVVDGVFTVPGDGMLDFDAVLTALGALKPHRYDGWLVVEAEQDPAKADPLTYATLGFRNLSQSARCAGLI
jgi:inosose dehydratase